MQRQYFLALGLIFILAVGLMMSIPTPSNAQFPPGVTPGTNTGPPIGGTGGPPFGEPTVFLTPTLPLTPLPTSSAPGCVTAFPIIIGSTVTVRGGINIRTTPSPSAPWLANFPESRNFVVLEGPVCGADFFWWRITGHGVNGWVAERNTVMNFITFVDGSSAPATCFAPLNLAVGEEIELVSGVRIRAEPSLQGLVLTVSQVESYATVLSGQSICEEGYNWRLVQVEILGVIYEGYMAEGSNSVIDDTYVATDEPDSICGRPVDLAVGSLGRVYYRDGIPKNLRETPGFDGEILYTLVTGVPFEVIGGPICVDDINWWQVRIRSNIPAAGWIAEGAPPNYWITQSP